MLPLALHIAFVFFILSLARAANDTCDLNWLYIDIHYRNVDARPEAYSYGLFIGAGQNSQNQSLWPAIAQNETFLASNDFCGDGKPANCHDSRFTHGHYGADASSSFKGTPQYTSLDTDAAHPNVNLTYGSDSLNLFTHFFDPSPATKHVIQDHPITVMSHYNSEQDVFFHSGSAGLGPESTILQQLVDDGRIGRPVVGFYLGTAYPRAGGTQNGSLVLGGYDAGRIAGPAHEYKQVSIPAPNASPFQIHIKQMSLVTNDGSSVPLVADDGFDAYISTTQYPMELPSALTNNLAAALKATSANNPENTFQLAQSFDGNITIILEDGYEITLPSEWISNASNITPFSASRFSSNATSDSNAPLVFGASFLHHLYMTIDYDAQTFSLADAKVSDYYVQPASLCPGTLPTGVSNLKANKFVQSGLIGAILGGVFGGVGLVWFLFFVIRKKLQHRRAKDAITKMEGGGKDSPKPMKSSLRTRAKSNLVRLSDKKGRMKSVQFKSPKRLSFSDSDTSLDKGVRITITEQAQETNSGIEMSNIRNAERNQSVSPLSCDEPAQTLSNMSPPDASFSRGGIQVQQESSIMQPLPTPSGFSNPYTELETPRTGNPLLGHYRGFSDIDDNDDSDLPPRGRPTSIQRNSSERHHKRTPSEQLRIDMGLRVDTAVSDTPKGARGKVREVRASSLTGSTRRKAPPTMLSPIVSAGAVPPGLGSGKKIPIRRAKTEADYVKRNPMRALFGTGGSVRSGSKERALRSIFPQAR